MTGWRLTPLAEVCTFRRGLTYAKSDEVEFSGNAVLRANNIDLATNLLNLKDIRYISDKIDVPDSKKVRSGSLLICTASGSRSHLGKVAIIDENYNMAFGGFMGLITPNEQIESRFLFHVLTSRLFQSKLDSLAGGTNINNLKFKDVADFEIPLPPLEEQRRIVAVLDEAFAAIATATANAEKNLANARELFQRCLSQVFDQDAAHWKEEPLNAHVRFVDYRGKTPPKRESGIRLITAKNVKMGYIQRHPEEFVDPAAYGAWMTRGLPKPGDVLFTTEAPLGNVAQLDTDEKVMIGQRLITMQPDQKHIYSAFLKYALCSPPLQKLILEKATGATVSGIKAKLLKLIPIRYPKQPEQREIVEKLNQIRELSEALATQAEAKRAALSDLKQTLLHRAFTGELTATAPDFIPA